MDQVSESPYTPELSDEWTPMKNDHRTSRLTMEKPMSDHREYKLVLLKNYLEALLVHDPTTEQSAAAMNVGIGYFSDPNEMPGLAHFCEHLLFMGSEAFQDENEFLRYIRGYCGSSNAYTVASNTCYFFSITSDYSTVMPFIDMETSSQEPAQRGNTSPFEGALKRFAAFFTGPLFKENCIETERKVVDSEYKGNRQSDKHRIFQLFKTQASEGHPWLKFGIGNSKTLENVQTKDLSQWWKEHYSASIMRLVIIGRESLDDLTRLVVDNFSAIPTKSSQPGVTKPPWEDDQKGYITYAKTVDDTYTMEISFCLNNKDEPYKSKPATYASRLIVRRGPGSLHAYLKENDWIKRFTSSLQQPARGFFFLLVRAELTKSGWDAYKSVLEAIYAYLYALADTWTFPYWKRHYEEFQIIQNERFNFSEKPDAKCIVNHLSEILLMHDSVPKAQLLRAPTGVWELDEEAVKRALKECLKPESGCVMLSSEILHSDSNRLPLQKEHWYDTCYKRAKLDKTLFHNAKCSNIFRDLTPPDPNRFIPEGSLGKPRITRLPTEMTTLWFGPSTLPKGYIGIYIRSPFARLSPTDPDSAKAHVMSKLVAAIIRDALYTEFYDALAAGVRFSVIYDEDGNFILQIYGYLEKIPDLLRLLLERMKSCAIREGPLSDCKEKFRQTFYNDQMASPANISRQLMDYALRNIGWTPAEMESMLPAEKSQHIYSDKITLRDVKEHRTRLLTSARTTVLVTGSFNQKDARDTRRIVEDIIPSSHDSDVGNSTNQLDPGKNWVYFHKLPNLAETNNAVEYYLQVDDPSQQPTLLLFACIVKDPFIDTLRTKGALGYNISSHAWVRGPALGMVFRVMSEVTTIEVERVIHEFLVDFQAALERMKPKDFAAFQDSLRKNLLREPVNQEQKAARLAFSILSETDFDLRKKNADAIHELKKEDILLFYTKYIAPPPVGTRDPSESSRRAKFSIHAHTKDITDIPPHYVLVDNLKQFRKPGTPGNLTPY